MDSTLNGWEVPLTLVKITQRVSEGELFTTETLINFAGVWQPLKEEQLALLPEGQRSWEHIWIHARASELNLETADKVKFNLRRYKVVSKKDYSLNGFVEYMLIRDYEESEVTSNDYN